MLTKLYLFLDDIFQPIPMRFGVCVVDYLFQSTLVQSQFDLVSRRRPFPFYCAEEGKGLKAPVKATLAACSPPTN